MIKEIANHRSIRKYKSSPIDEEVLSDILHSAARASTCGNMQLYSLVVTLDARVRAELAPCHFNQAMVTEAPCVVTAETREHLGGRLAADTPVDEAVAGEEVGIGPDPVIRNGIAHEDHFDGFTRQGGILPFVTPVLRPVAGLLGRERKRRENRQRQEYDFFHRAIRFLGFPLTKLGNPE